MNANVLGTLAAWSYGVAAAGYLAFAIRVAFGRRWNARSLLLEAAVLATASWAAADLTIALTSSRAAGVAADAADALRYGAWFLFLGQLLDGKRRAGSATIRTSFRPWVVAIAGVALAASFALSAGLPVGRMLGLPAARTEFGLRLGLAVLGAVLVEQLLRRVDPQARWAIKPMGLALAGVFGFDVYYYAEAMLFGSIDASAWIARGFVNATLIPLLAIASARNTGWTVEMHLSRGAVLHTAALVLSGSFLMAAAAAGYFVRFFGGTWGQALQIEVIFAALLLVALVASSGRFRAKLKVFVSKHFFSYRYDYREEWLRFTRTLSTESTAQAIQQRVIAALGDLVESPAGMLWLKAADRFEPAARWNTPAIDAPEPADASLASFLERTGWVVCLADYASKSTTYEGLQLPGWLAKMSDAWLIVPLASGQELIGFVILVKPRTPIDLNWEVRDLLKAASRQAASYLGQLRATEALVEARKFDAFNRMSAFVVHDLKNLVSQLSLMLKNAQRHRHNPEFQRDMLSTVEHVVERMNRLMLQLRTGTTPVDSPRPVELEPLVRRVCAAKANSEHQVTLELACPAVALGHEDRLEHVMGHLLQNALDASIKGGQVSVRVDCDGGFAVIEVADTGVGMSAEFVRDRLFKPFETTKRTGMGIGVYESLQYISGLGGQMLVDSAPNAGTRVRVRLPLRDAAGSPAPAPVKEVA